MSGATDTNAAAERLHQGVIDEFNATIRNRQQLHFCKR